MKDSKRKGAGRAWLICAMAVCLSHYSVSCGNPYGDTDVYKKFVNTFEAEDPSQFNLNRNICAYMARESLGLADYIPNDWVAAVRDYIGIYGYVTDNCNGNPDETCINNFMADYAETSGRFGVDIATECLDLEAWRKAVSNIASGAPGGDDAGDASDEYVGDGGSDESEDGSDADGEEPAILGDLKTCIDAQMKKLEDQCKRLHLSPGESENGEYRFAARIVDDDSDNVIFCEQYSDYYGDSDGGGQSDEEKTPKRICQKTVCMTHAPDWQPDANTDEDPDVPIDENPDAPIDETPDAPIDETPDVPIDEDPDVPIDENPDVPIDENPDVPIDGDPDIPIDENPDAPIDETPDVPIDEDPDVPIDGDPDVPIDTPDVPTDEGSGLGQCEVPDDLAFRLVYNYRQCPAGYKVTKQSIETGGKKYETYTCLKATCGGQPVDILSDAANCNGCGNACPDGYSCSNGKCMPATCASGESVCNGYCVNFSDTHIVSCTPMRGMECEIGYTDCDGLISTGCEAMLSGDADNCGICGTVCPSSMSCEDGFCKPAKCGDDFSGIICAEDGVSQCVYADTDADNCGACGHRCSENSVVNAQSGVCKDGRCRYECNDGYTNVASEDGGDIDTAENIICVDLQNNNVYCGERRQTCAPGYYCAEGACEPTGCDDPFQMPCGESKTCADVSSDDENCGSCGNSCKTSAGTPYCHDSACVECVKDEHCALRGLKCSEYLRKCVECTNDAHCSTNGDGVCTVEGYCVYIDCAPGYHVDRFGTSCEPDSIYACGSAGNNCVTLKTINPNIADLLCDEGDCLVTDCLGGYHPTADSRTCVKDTEYECGPSRLNCNSERAALNASAMKCENQACYVAKCRNGYKISSDRQTCEKSSDKK